MIILGGMKIQVANIPDEGLELNFSQKDGWVRDKISKALGPLYRAEDPISGHLSVRQTLENIFVKATANLKAHSNCDRCLNPYDFDLKVSSERLLTPLYGTEGRKKKKDEGAELELTQEDLDFSYYEGDEIDAGEILREQIVLEQPITHLCRADCKGLCPHCGINRNEGRCSCDEKAAEDSPFAVLKDMFKG